MNAERAAIRSGEAILGPNPFVGFRAADLVREAFSVLRRALRQPKPTGRAVTALVRDLRVIARGDSDRAPAPKDRRFADPAWSKDARYRRWLQAYLALEAAMTGWAEQQALDDVGRARLQFFLQLFLDAVAPSNFPWQPEAIRRFRESRGHSAVDGINNLIRDIAENRGLPAQVDKSQFKVGGNLATTEGAVILRSELLELIQYTPAAAAVRQIPLLIVPPQINKFYVFDLSAEKSMVKGLLERGFQVFIVSWRNPTVANRDWGLAEYASGIELAVSAICNLTGAPRVNLTGACAGGITLASYIATRAAAGDPRVGSLSLVVNVLDIAAMGDTPLGLFATPASIRAAKQLSRSKGVLDGKDMASAFSWLRPNDLIWNYWVNNILLGNKPPAFDVLYWNNDSTRLPARLHGEFLDIYQSNALARPGQLRLHGIPVDLSRIQCDAYLVAGNTDHITPWKACYRSTQLLGGQNTFVLSNSGHIQSILNPPGNRKAEFWAGAGVSPGADDWRASAKQHAGSWWPHWHAWLEARSGELQAASPALGNASYPSLAPAPGTYVLE